MAAPKKLRKTAPPVVKAKVAKRVRKPAEVERNDNVLFEHAEAYINNRALRDNGAAGMKARAASMMEYLDAHELDKVDGDDYRVQVVSTSSTVTDQEQLAAALGPKMWKKITTTTLDKNKLDAYVKSGEIDAAVVAKCQSTVHGTSYVKVTKK